MNPTRSLAALSLAVLLALAAGAATAQTAPRIDDAWARPTATGQAAGGGFLKITSPQADRLVAASTPVAKSVELHTMQMDGDIMRMRQVPAIELPAGQTVELRPGGLHVMFVGLAQPLVEGARFPLTLRFEKAGEVRVEVAVSARQLAPMQGHKH